MLSKFIKYESKLLSLAKEILYTCDHLNKQIFINNIENKYYRKAYFHARKLKLDFYNNLNLAIKFRDLKFIDAILNKKYIPIKNIEAELACHCDIFQFFRNKFAPIWTIIIYNAFKQKDMKLAKYCGTQSDFAKRELQFFLFLYKK